MRIYIVFHQNSSKSEIRINEESKFIICVDLKENIELKPNQENCKIENHELIIQIVIC